MSDAFTHLITVYSMQLSLILCDAEGGYEPVQYAGEKCWYVEQFGNKMLGTRVPASVNQTIDC